MVAMRSLLAALGLNALVACAGTPVPLDLAHSPDVAILHTHYNLKRMTDWEDVELVSVDGTEVRDRNTSNQILVRSGDHKLEFRVRVGKKGSIYSREATGSLDARLQPRTHYEVQRDLDGDVLTMWLVDVDGTRASNPVTVRARGSSAEPRDVQAFHPR